MELTVNEALNIAAKKHNEGNFQEAETIYKKVLEISPNNADAHHLLGLIAYQNNDLGGAIKEIKKAIKLKPNIDIFHFNLGTVYDSIGKENESLEQYKKSIKIGTDFEKAYLAYYNLAIDFKNKSKFYDSLRYYSKAIELKPDFAEAHWNKSLVLLLLDNFKEGFKEFEYRFKKEDSTDKRKFNIPKWDGSSLNNKKILMISEQGFGDNIQFIRYTKILKKLGAYIILECKKDLIRLFKNIKEIDRIIEKGEPILNVGADYYIHLMSLPCILKTDLNNIPNKIPYLKSNQPLSNDLKEKLNTKNLRIGIAWAGNPNQADDKTRSTKFKYFQTLKMPGIQLFSLQMNNSELNDPDIIDLKDDINDFLDTSSIINNLDLIISVDTSVAHLAGAMGKPIWTLLSYIPDWRWLLKTKNSPWYPEMRLFRQQKKGDWNSVFEEIKQELGNLLKGKNNSEDFLNSPNAYYKNANI